MAEKKKNKLKLHFYGGAQEVTGACYVLEAPEAKIMVDCGLIQGAESNQKKNHEPFPFNPSSISAVFITHPHLDHVGRLPKLVKDGFAGKIYSVPPARDFAELVLEDSLSVFEKHLRREGKGDLLYKEEDIRKTMSLWETEEYHKEISSGPFKVTLKDPGHILGSAMIEIDYNGTKVVFTGDLGNISGSLEKETEVISNANYLVMEALYGDKEHVEAEGTQLKLERIIEDTVRRKGVLMIPAFSLERTQKILFQINNLVEEGRVPRVPVFLDSPLAIKTTNVYKKYSQYFNENVRRIISSDKDIFNFPGLKTTLRTEESKEIDNVPPPKIIIAGSGMSNGGRILHHEKRYLSDPNNILMIVSYQVPGSLGRQLQDGVREVNIMGEDVFVKAQVIRVEGYSSHPDINGLITFVERTLDDVKKIFVVQGEPKSELFFVQRLKDALGVDVYAPQYGEVFELEV